MSDELTMFDWESAQRIAAATRQVEASGSRAGETGVSGDTATSQATMANIQASSPTLDPTSGYFPGNWMTWDKVVKQWVAHGAIWIQAAGVDTTKVSIGRLLAINTADGRAIFTPGAGSGLTVKLSDGSVLFTGVTLLILDPPSDWLLTQPFQGAAQIRLNGLSTSRIRVTNVTFDSTACTVTLTTSTDGYSDGLLTS